MLLRCFKRISCVGMGMHSVDRFGLQSLGLWGLHWEQGSDAAPLGVSSSVPKFGWGYLLPPHLPCGQGTHEPHVIRAAVNPALLWHPSSCARPWVWGEPRVRALMMLWLIRAVKQKLACAWMCPTWRCLERQRENPGHLTHRQHSGRHTHAVVLKTKLIFLQLIVFFIPCKLPKGC